MNKILEDGKLSEIGIVVIDELHMVGDEDRGYLLELLLTKLRFAAGGGVKAALPPTPLLEGAPGTSKDTPGGTETPSGGTSQSSTPSQEPGLQIVGMSATMPNVESVAQWLDAALYKTDFRPVPLEEFVKVGVWGAASA
jgi:DNA polymerase theta